MSNETKQTAVEWYAEKSIILFDNLRSGKITFKIWFKEQSLLLGQAKEMEKEQTLDFTRNAVRKILDEDRQNPFNLEQYYNETYGGNK
jgi:hypothetical protein